eukprot:TRINITY_DN15066_c0_g1_i1.p1 TRINITY_DN15066_c0_g1~~TRINITY_DN15066_c0_g1_i1.p1  ORF type:complete len:109 (+),score=19.67 TRINITY_DN15066_c0_g1_i1:36-362(+)
MSRTHTEIDQGMCGTPVELKEGSAKVELAVVERMKVDARGLVHGGYVFGLADYAAMLAVNDPNVVLGEATTRFVAPVRVGDVLTATATVTEEKGKKRMVKVTDRKSVV